MSTPAEEFAALFVAASEADDTQPPAEVEADDTTPRSPRPNTAQGTSDGQPRHANPAAEFAAILHAETYPQRRVT